MPRTAAAPAAELLDERCSTPGLLLALLGQHAMRHLRAVHTRHGLSPRQFQLLGLVHDRGPMGQRELGQSMGIDPSILVTLLNPLEAEGLLSRERESCDRRRHVVTLTTKGEGRLTTAAQAHQEAEDLLLSGLDAGQRDQLRALLIALESSLSGECGASPDDGDGCPGTGPDTSEFGP